MYFNKQTKQWVNSCARCAPPNAPLQQPIGYSTVSDELSLQAALDQ
jgi:hypothetical protein